MTARLELSETASRLIRHAANDISSASIAATRPGRILLTASGHSADPRIWLRETALLRMMAVVEAYVDAVSIYRIGKVVDQNNSYISLLVDDFELTSSNSWQERHTSFERYHGFTLRSRKGWGSINAGIDVRNCLMHGMGTLTAKQRTQTKLAAAVKEIDVTVGSNRMHLSATTIPRLAKACEEFVADVDTMIVLAL